MEEGMVKSEREMFTRKCQKEMSLGEKVED